MTAYLSWFDCPGIAAYTGRQDLPVPGPQNIVCDPKLCRLSHPLLYKYNARCRYLTWYMTNHIAATQNGHCMQIMDVSHFSSACQFLSDLRRPYIPIHMMTTNHRVYTISASVSSKSHQYPFPNY